MGRMRKVWLAALACTLAAGCSGNTQPVPVPSPVAKPTTTETFNGTIQQGGSFQYQFKVAVNGEVHVTLKAEASIAVDANPDATPPVAAKPSVPVAYPLNVRIGQSSLTTLGLTCTNLKLVTTAPGDTPQLTGQALTGTFCVDVSDAVITDSTLALPEPVTITVTIDHS
jgi:hypothetical protein